MSPFEVMKDGTTLTVQLPYKSDDQCVCKKGKKSHCLVGNTPNECTKMEPTLGAGVCLKIPKYILFGCSCCGQSEVAIVSKIVKRDERTPCEKFCQNRVGTCGNGEKGDFYRRCCHGLHSSVKKERMRCKCCQGKACNPLLESCGNDGDEGPRQEDNPNDVDNHNPNDVDNNDDLGLGGRWD